MSINIKPIVTGATMKLKQYSPEILTFTGIAGMTAGAVGACVATRKLDPVLDEHNAQVSLIHEKYKDDAENKAKNRELTKTYLKTGAEFIKLYGPSVAVGTLSAAGILTGNNILRKRNIALAAAYATIDTSFRQYRSRVVDRFGEQVDKELRFDGRQEKIEVTETDEKGKEKKVKKNVTVFRSGLSDYARYFAYGEAKAAEPNLAYNKMFLEGQQRVANEILRGRGFLFLNEVYSMLGLEQSLAGQAVGWVYDKNRDDHGDNYVDFGIQEVHRKHSDKAGDYEKVFLLDFNVDGSILNHAQENGLITK